MSILALLQLQEVESQKKLIPDFLTWSQCFAVYTAVLGADQPQQFAELMAYQFEMAKYARKYRWPSWVVYDINYGQEAAGRSSLSWAEAAGHREAKLFSQCFTGMAKDPHEAWCRSCQSLDHSTSNCPIMPSRKILIECLKERQPRQSYLRSVVTIIRKAAISSNAIVGISAFIVEQSTLGQCAHTTTQRTSINMFIKP